MAMKRYPTKIIPPHYGHIFEREHLFELVKQRQATPIIWVNGPPGSGKTVFVASLLAKQQASFLWYRMDDSENNIEDIFYFLTLAASKNYPRKKLKLPVFTAEYADNIENFARVFFRQLFASLTSESAIVLDNCQEAEQNSVFYRLLLIAANELPHDMQIVCISRNHPGALLKRLYLNKELLEIGSDELLFKQQESRAFLKWLNPQFSDHDIHHIQSKTQGWAAGMVLMAEQYKLSGFADNVDNDENIFEYLISEILSNVPKEHHNFLVQSALFTQLTAEMGVELTGYQKAQSYLNELVSKNFLIERTASSNPVYSYHPLFRECLLNEADRLFTETDWHKIQQKAAMILVKQDRTVEAMSLYRKLQDWGLLKDLLLQQADELIKTGRHHSVSLWMEALPINYLETDAWLNYWYAQALKPVAPLLAVERLEKSYQQFIINNDITGIYSAWQAAVESISISMDDYSMLGTWVQRFDELRRDYPACPSIQLKVRFYATAVQALSFYNPQHPWLRGLIKICEGVLRLAPIRVVKMMLSTQLGHYYILTCQLTKLQTVSPHLKSALNDETLPVLPRIISAYILGLQKQYSAEADEALTYTQHGLELSEQSGIPLFKGMLHAHNISCHINNGDLINAEKALQTALDSGNVRQRMLVAMHYSYAAWLAALAGDKSYALEQNQQALQLTKSINVEVGYVCSLALKVQVLAETGQWKKSQQSFALLSTAAKGSNNTFNLIQFYVSDAWLAYLQHDQAHVLSVVRQLLQMLHSEQILTFFGWRPEVMVPLCIVAIENGIEEDFAVRLLKSNQLLTEPPLYLEKWPWPVRIYSFATLQIEIDGKLLEPSGKSQKKILELLVAIVALGGKNVNGNQLGQLLWPDSDGDVTAKSLETGLHRLRKLIGKQAVLLKAGRVYLNQNYCWLDLWAFEKTAKELNNTLSEEANTDTVIRLTDRLLHLYRGSFLSHAEYGLAKLKQEQLQSKLYRIIDKSANYHEQRQEMDRARYLLEKGLELEPMLEENYIRLMSHYIKLDQTSQALHIYHQCRRTLYEGFGIPLSAKIESLFLQLEN